MFKCYECEKAFSEPKHWTENHGETFAGCPYCGGSFDEAVKCEACDEYFFESQLKDVCQDCIDELKERYSKLLKDNFTEFELETLEAVF